MVYRPTSPPYLPTSPPYPTSPAYHNQALRDVDQGSNLVIYSIDEVVTDDELLRRARYEEEIDRQVAEKSAFRQGPIVPEMDEVVTDEEYFTRADLDEDGRICKAEGLAFFQGSNLPKYTIDEIWRIAANKQEGFLGREEFKNALRLVSLVQQRLERGEDVILSVVKETLLSLGRAKNNNNNIPAAPRIKIVTPDQHLKWLADWATHPAVNVHQMMTYHRQTRRNVFPNGDMLFPPEYHGVPPYWVPTTKSSSSTPPPADS